MNFPVVFILCNVALKGKRESMWLDEESLKLLDLYPVAHTGTCVSFLPEQQKCCKKPAWLFLFHMLICAHSSNALPSPDWQVRKGCKERNCGLPHLSLCFCVIIFSRSVGYYTEAIWLRKNVPGILGQECDCPLCVFKASSDWNTGTASRGLRSHTCLVLISSLT